MPLLTIISCVYDLWWSEWSVHRTRAINPASATHLPSVSISLIISIFCENKLSISSSSSVCVCFWAQLKKNFNLNRTLWPHGPSRHSFNLVGKHDKVLKWNGWYSAGTTSMSGQIHLSTTSVTEHLQHHLFTPLHHLLQPPLPLSYSFKPWSSTPEIFFAVFPHV